MRLCWCCPVLNFAPKSNAANDLLCGNPRVLLLLLLLLLLSLLLPLLLLPVGPDRVRGKYPGVSPPLSIHAPSLKYSRIAHFATSYTP